MFLKLHLVGWYWLIRLYKFYVYNSTIHIPILHCVLTTHSLVPFCHHVFDPLSSFHALPPSFHFVTTILLPVSVSVCLLVALCFISHMSVKSHGSCPFPSVYRLLIETPHRGTCQRSPRISPKAASLPLLCSFASLWEKLTVLEFECWDLTGHLFSCRLIDEIQ